MEYKSTDSSDDSALREKKLFRITLRGSLINVILLILKVCEIKQQAER